MSILQSTFDKHKKLMFRSLLNEAAPPYNSGGIYFRIMTGTYDNEEVIKRMENEYPQIKVYRDNAVTGNRANSDGATLLLKNADVQLNLYKDLLNKKILKVIEFPKSNSRIGGKKRFFRLMKSPNVEGYISWSDIESSGIGSFDRIEVDADDDKQGITITIDSNFEGGFGTEASEKFDELVDKKMVRLIGFV